MNRLENIITLTDSQGNDVDYEILDIFPFEGTDYAALLPLDDESDAPEVTILEVLHAAEDEDGGDSLRGLDSETLLQAVFEAFMERNRDQFDFS